MRTFEDAAGREWTVFEVKRQSAERGGWSYVPEGYGTGWLCFESNGVKRRLSPVPTGWRSVELAELARLLDRAQPVIVKPRPDRGDDAQDSRA
jgi:hypothetical protein